MSLKHRTSSRNGGAGGGLVKAARVIASPTSGVAVGGVVPLGCTGCPNDCNDGGGGVKQCYDIWGAYWLCDTWEVRYQGRRCGLPDNLDFRFTEKWFGTSECYAIYIKSVPFRTCANINGSCEYVPGELDELLDNPIDPPTTTPSCGSCSPPSIYTVSDTENYTSTVTEQTITDWTGCSGAPDYPGCTNIFFQCKKTYRRQREWGFDPATCAGFDIGDSQYSEYERTDQSFQCGDNTDYSACPNATIPGYCTTVLPPAPILKQRGVVRAFYIGLTLVSYFKSNYKNKEVACRLLEDDINCSTDDPADPACPDTYGLFECDPGGTPVTVTTTLRDDAKYEITRTVTTETVNSSTPVTGSCPSGESKCGNSGYTSGESLQKIGQSTYTRTVVKVKFDPC